MGRTRRLVATHLSQPQHRNAYYLMANPIVGAAAGVVFWFVFTRVAGLPPAAVGLGYSIVALGTIAGVVAKAGMDTALIRHVPRTSSSDGKRLLLMAVALGATVAVATAAVMAATAHLTGWVHELHSGAWLLVAAIGVLLVVTWLQDAWFVAEGDARRAFHRNLAFSAARLALPLPLVLLALPLPVGLAWAFALAVSALVAALFVARLGHRAGAAASRRGFLRSSLRNLSGSAAEFLPGLLLTPVVLAANGPEAAAFFGIAWTAASLLFLASAAVSRSALAQMVRSGPAGERAALGRVLTEHLWTVVPAAVAVVVFAPWALAVFGPEYAARGGPVLRVLAASILVVAPTYAYLAVLRARERSRLLVAFPAGLIATLAIAAPLLAPYGGVGVAWAWFAANVPFAAVALWKLADPVQEVVPDDAASFSGRAHVE